MGCAPGRGVAWAVHTLMVIDLLVVGGGEGSRRLGASGWVRVALGVLPAS